MLDVPTLLFMLVLTDVLVAAALWVGIGPGARHGAVETGTHRSGGLPLRITSSAGVASLRPSDDGIWRW